MALKMCGTTNQQKSKLACTRHDKLPNNDNEDKVQNDDNEEAYTSMYSNTIMVFSSCRQAP